MPLPSRSLWWGLSLAALILWLTVRETHADQIRPIRPATRTSAIADGTEKRQPRHQISRQNLLHIDRSTPYGLPATKLLGSTVAPVSLNILAIRVDFPTDVTDETTGNGRFDYRSPAEFEQAEGHVIDQAPHDRLYFERHLSAMNAYYEAVSYGQFSTTARVVPDALAAAYTLPRQMSFYSPNVDFFDPLKIERLVDFVTDTFTAADQDPSIDFSAYDAFIIFHAGSDLQHDRLLNSPSDLQSGFLRIGDERPPIRVDGGAVEIREMILMPETTSQDSNIGALNVTLAHEFGHQLSLPDLYSTFSFAPGVGSFDLMDLESGTVDIGESGQQIVTGVMPVNLSAWSRAFLGWLNPIEITADSTAVGILTSNSQAAGTKAIKIPVAPGEYFLIENRQTDLDGDGVAFLNFVDGIVVGPSDANKQPNLEYDYLLPGSGVLIWHVDENVALGDFDGNGVVNWEENAVQWDESHRFLDLEEADGIQDIGLTIGSSIAEDMFYAGNNTLFGPETNPDSRHYNGGDSHLTVKIDSPSGLIMDLVVDRKHARDGWPVAMGGPAANRSPVVADVTGDRFAETFIASSDGKLYAWQHDGSKLISNSRNIETVTFSNDTLTVPAAVFAESPGSFFNAPAIADLDNNGSIEIISSDAERVFVWNPVDTDLDGLADIQPGYPVSLIQQSSIGPQSRLTSPALYRNGPTQTGIVVATSAGGLIALSAGGSVLFSISLSEQADEGINVPPAAADLDGDGLDELVVTTARSKGGRVIATDVFGSRLWSAEISTSGRASAPIISDIDGDGKYDVIVAGSGGRIWAWDATGTLKTGWPVDALTNLAAPPAAGDLDGDGLPEIVISGFNRISAWHSNGSPVTNFPVLVNRAEPIGIIGSSPAIGDLDGDLVPEIIVGLPSGVVTAYTREGSVANGFPLGTSGPISSSPALADITGNGDIAVVSGSDDGFVHFWTFRGNPGALPWPMLAHDPRRTGASFTVSQPPVPQGGSLLVDRSAFCYPNPVNSGSTAIRYRLRRNAQVRVRIYNLAGDLVDSFDGTGDQNQNEVVWQVRNIVSGIYLCRVEASDTTGSQAALFKIAIVK